MAKLKLSYFDFHGGRGEPARLGSIGYGIYCRLVRLSMLLHLSIIAAIVSNAVYWQLDSLSSAYVVSVIAGAAYMTGTLIQLDLTARIIPARAAATVFGAHQFCGVGV